MRVDFPEANPPQRMSSSEARVSDEEGLRWAAIERLPTFDRLRKGILRQMLDNGEVVETEIDLQRLGRQEKKVLLDGILGAVEDDNEKFLRRLRDRIDRVGIEVPKIEIRFEHLTVEGDVHVGGRALPTLLNATINSAEAVLGLLRFAPSKKKVIKILKDVNGIVKPSRMTLLLGPPGAGKTTLLTALAGKLDKNMRVNGKVTYCGHEFDEFVPQRTCAYIGQHDLHLGEMTVRETFDFSNRCLGVGTQRELLAEVARREKEAAIIPDPDIDAYMKSMSIEDKKTSIITDYVIKILGLDICADMTIGNEMIRGISGGQKKRVTSGEMLVGPFRALLMDEISNGLDTSTTFQICKHLKQMVHVMDVTTIVSLLQPAPETYELFDDVILLSEGQIVYQGARENVLEFFESVGFKCPERKGVADFLQEVTSRKDQEQYWSRRNKPYRFISVSELAENFQSFHVGEKLEFDLIVPYDKSMTHKAALVKQKYGLSNWNMLKACFSRELLLMKRNSIVYIFNFTQITIIALITMTVFYRTTMPHETVADGEKYYGAVYFGMSKVFFNGFAELALTIFRLPVFYKQRDALFYPSWIYALPIWVFRIPISLVESWIWVILTYYTIGYAPTVSRFFRQFLTYFSIHQMALSIYLLLGAVGRTMVIASTEAILSVILMFSLGGFIVAEDDIPPWMIWGYYASPAMYGQNALLINEFLDERWSSPNTDPTVDQPTVGKVLLASRGFFTEEYWYWVCTGALFGFSLLFNIMFVLALKYLNPYADSGAMSFNENRKLPSKQGDQRTNIVTSELTISGTPEGGMLLPFQPLSLVFSHVNYYVDMPAEITKVQEVEEDRLQLLQDVSGAFRPGILTALVGVSGAGKTTLMDVLAGRKTNGYIEGSVYLSGYAKKQETFARIIGYCEQTDIHSPNVTIYESLLFSAWLRLPFDVCYKTRKMFVEEVMELMELNPLRNALVGLPGVNGLSTEQRKRLTIAVELVANPSIIFMDEPTSGLDARAAAIVMRTVRNTVNTGRTVVCTIHQPSIDIFETFDELLFLKMGGQIIYAGPLDHQSNNLIEYFEAIPGIPKIPDGYNPATWMLEITTPQLEAQLGIDFADHYTNSSLYRSNQDLIAKLSTPSPGSVDLFFPTAYSQPFISQCKACFWKQYWSYWRNPSYNAIRFLTTIVLGLFFGLVFWKHGGKLDNMIEFINLFGALFAAPIFLGSVNTVAVQPVVAVERTVFYRERAARMYSSLAYAFAQVAVEIIYVLLQAFVYSILLFSMIGFEWTTSKFLYFYYFIFMCFTYLTLFGMMLVALTPNEQIGAVFMSFFTGMWSLFAGFLIPLPQIPIWWRWYFWASPMAWTLYGLMTSQLGDRNTPLAVPGVDNMTVKTFLESRYGFHYDFLPIVVAAHVGWVLLFLLVFACGIKFLNFLKR